MKRFLSVIVLAAVLVFPHFASALNIPVAVEVMSSQTVGASGTFTSAAQDLSDWSAVQGYFALSFKCWDAGTPDCKYEILCYDEVDGTYVAPATAASGGTITEGTGLITSSTNTDFTTPANPQVVEFDMPLCTRFKVKMTNNDGAAAVWSNVFIVGQ